MQGRGWIVAKQCCPKCKDTSGYRYGLRETRYLSTYGWTAEDEPEETGGVQRESVTLFECLNCGHKMRESTVLAIRGLTND
jgi:Zn ribbon nucleic-acid-binding protein